MHGFGGSSTSTWDQFPSLLPREPACTGSDIIFYGYDGLYTRSDISAVLLYEFLHELLTSPSDIINRSLDSSHHRLTSFSYNKIVIVAHSLGAIVSRRAVLNAFHNEDNWTGKVRLALFAPAHMGANVAKLAVQAITTLPWVGNVLAPLVQFKFKVLQDLETESLTLQQLHDDTRQTLNGQDASCLIAKKVILGEKDGVVNPNRFCSDPVPKVFLAKDHVRVCKPDSSFLAPIQEVLELL